MLRRNESISSMIFPIISTKNWYFHFSVSDLQKMIDPSIKEQSFVFESEVDLVKHLADNWDNDGARFQRWTQDRLNADRNLKLWNKHRTYLKVAKNFGKYRNNPRRYNDAAEFLCAGGLDSSRTRCAQNLLDEINTSKIIIPTGQVVFHGGSFQKNGMPLQITRFLSTSLDPCVAAWHAIRDRPGVVLIISINAPISALWVNTWRLREYEILLPCGIEFRVDAVHDGKYFAVMEVTLKQPYRGAATRG